IPATGNCFRISTIVVCALSRGTITVNSTNPQDPPSINPNYLLHPQDMAIMQCAVARAQNFVTAPVWNGFILDNRTITTVDDIRNGGYSVYVSHRCRLGSYGPRSEDERCGGVRIVDASVSFAPFSRADLSLFIYIHSRQQVAVHAIAERAADLIKSDGIYHKIE
ncbi:hypothetical protein F5146DRAFT_938665, partial [Armillaria mellea]